MKRKSPKNVFSPIVLTILGLVFLAGCDNSSKNTQTSKLALAKSVDLAGLITITEAIDIALGELGGGIAIEAELEDEDENEPTAFEVLVYVEGKNSMVEVEVNARNGAVLEVEVEEEGDDDEYDEADDDN